MRLPTLVRPMLIAALAVSPVMLHAQIATRTVCNDGTIARTGGAAACTAHRGVDQRRTASARSVERTQSSAEAGRPGIPAPRPVRRTEPTRASTRVPSGIHRLPPAEIRPPHPAETARRMPERSKAKPRSDGRLCKDGTTVHGNGKDGNCGGHGGVAPHDVHTARTEAHHDQDAGKNHEKSGKDHDRHRDKKH